MADEKKVLIDVEIKISDAVKNLADIKAQMADLKANQKALGAVTDENRAEYEAYSIALKQLSAVYQVQQKEVLNAEKADRAKIGSMEQMKAQLSLLTSEYTKMSEVERNEAAGVEMQTKIKGIQTELSNTEGELGLFNRKVGDYENAINSALGTNNGFLGSLMSVAKGSGSMNGVIGMLSTSVKAFGKSLLSLLANPVVAIVAAIAAVFMILYAVFEKIIETIKGNSEQSKKLELVMQPLRLIGDALTKVFEKLADVFLSVAGALSTAVSAVLDFIGVTNDANQTTADYIALEKEKQALGKATRALNENVAKGERDIAELRAKAADKEKYAVKERMGFNKQAKAIEESLLVSKLNIAREELKIAIEESKRNKASKEQIDKISEAKIKLYNIEREYNQGMRALNREESRFLKEESKDAAAAAAARKAAADKQFETMIANIEAQKTYNVKYAETRNSYYNQDFLDAQDSAREIFDLQQEGDKRKLKAQLEHGKITKSQYKQQYDILALDLELFISNQTKALTAEYKRQQDLLKKTEEQEIKAVEEKYAKELKAYEKNAKEMHGTNSDDKEYLDDVNNYALQLGKQQAKEIKAIRKASITSTIAEIEEQLTEHYGNDLKEYTDNELEKTKVVIAQLKERISLIDKENEKRKAAGKEAISTAEEEAQLRAAQAKQAQLQLTNELLDAQLTSKGKLDLKRAEIEAELELYKGNTTKELELKAKLAQADKDYASERIASFENYAGKVSELGTALTDLMKATEDSQLQDYEDSNAAKKEALDKRLASGLISQSEYDAQIAANDKKLDKQKAEIARKQAIREKALKAFDIGVNTATAIMKIWADTPTVAAPFMTALVAGIGAMQLATVMATPIPKASRGMLLNGASHAQGGIMIEAEGGEAIINKRSTSMYAPILSAINQAGGGVAFTGTSAKYTDGGYAARRAADSSSDLASELKGLREDMKRIKIYTSIEDVNKGQKNYARIVDRASY